MARHGKARLGKAWLGGARLGKARQGLPTWYLIRPGGHHSWPGTARQGSARRDLAGRGMAWRGTARQGHSQQAEKTMHSSEQNKHDQALCENFIRQQEDGEILDWLSIECATGVTMNPRGRRLLRAAVRAAGRVVYTLRGKGVQLSSADTAAAAMGAGAKKIQNVVRREKKTHELLRARHIEDMSVKDRDRFNSVGVLLELMDGAVTNTNAELPRKPRSKASPLALVDLVKK